MQQKGTNLSQVDRDVVLEIRNMEIRSWIIQDLLTYSYKIVQQILAGVQCHIVAMDRQPGFIHTASFT